MVRPLDDRCHLYENRRYVVGAAMAEESVAPEERDGWEVSEAETFSTIGSMTDCGQLC